MTWDAGYRTGYNQGFDQGYDKGSTDSSRHDSPTESSWDEREQMCYSAGEGIVDRMLPPEFILPDVSLEEIVEAGLASRRDQWIPLASAHQVFDEMRAALDQRSPYSLVRLGDGELLTLAQRTVLDDAEVKRRGPFLEYAGIRVPDLAARDALAASIRKATVVGVPDIRKSNYQLLLHPVCRSMDLDLRSMRLTFSLVHFLLSHYGFLGRLLEGRRLLLVGNKAEALAQVLRTRGHTVTGVVGSVQGFKDVERVVGVASGVPHDLALVSAGIAAVPIAERIASACSTVAIDFGHLADAIVKGKAE